MNIMLILLCFAEEIIVKLAYDNEQNFDI